MDEHAVAEELPGLYRAILDGVARLEQAGDRREAHRIRREATLRYSTAWDDRCRRQLTGLLRRLDRSLATKSRGRIAAESIVVPTGPAPTLRRTELA